MKPTAVRKSGDDDLGPFRTVQGEEHQGAKLLFAEESEFQKVIVTEDERGVRRMLVNNGLEIQSTWYPKSVLTGDYPDGVLLAPLLVGKADLKVLMIGVGGGAISRAFGKFYPKATITGVEIDPVVHRAGELFMGVGENQRLTVVEAEGRTFLESSQEKYDLIVVDAYEEIFIPSRLATKEFYELAKEHLNSDGLVVLNVADITGGEFPKRVAGTLAHPLKTFSWHFHRNNTLIFGFAAGVSKEQLVGRLQKVSKEPLLGLAVRMAEKVRGVARSKDPITDDLSVEAWNPDETQWGLPAKETENNRRGGRSLN